MSEITWGILSTAKIGRKKVIPAMQKADNCIVRGIASRSNDRAKQVAKELNIPEFYGSYEELLADPGIQAVYNPLPNHMHVPWTLKAMQAGKHVLCEKPLAMSAEEASNLLAGIQEFPKLKVMEAFMYRFHPQWKRVKALVEQGKIGDIQTINSFFAYYNRDPANIRNQEQMGGGGLMDIGCYCISLSRFIFGREPDSITGQWKIDGDFKSDYLASGVMDFGDGMASFTCSTQTSPHQEVQIVGTDGRIIIEIPFNAPPHQKTCLWLVTDKEKKKETFPAVDQYTLQAEKFSRAIAKDTPVPTPLSDAVKNMKVIEAFRKSARELKTIKVS